MTKPTKLVNERDLVSATESALAMDRALKSGKKNVNAAYWAELRKIKRAGRHG